MQEHLQVLGGDYRTRGNVFILYVGWLVCWV